MKRKLLRWLMKRFERFPTPDRYDMGEIFDHPDYVEGDNERRRKIQHRSSLMKYEDERRCPWDAYFGIALRPLLRGRDVLDLGCFTGGRTLAWAERYGPAHCYGIDVRFDFAQAARRFASHRGSAARFAVGVGEAIPFRDNCLDAILSYDVFEHTRDVERVLAECRRVLRPGGRLFVVFPGYFHPIEHHLGCVTLTPCLHWFFSGADLVAEYNRIVAERGDQARWYARRRPGLASWERCHTINGTTVRAFRRMIGRGGWTVEREVVLPLFRVGRAVGRRRILRVIGWLIAPLAHLPVLEEALRHRIVYVLRKPDGS